MQYNFDKSYRKHNWIPKEIRKIGKFKIILNSRNFIGLISFGSYLFLAAASNFYMLADQLKFEKAYYEPISVSVRRE